MSSRAEGPYFDELVLGQVFTAAPALTITEGHAAVHQSIVGDRLAMALDRSLSRRITGESSFVHPALVWDIAIGQSTVATQHVKANLFYRGLTFRRYPTLGDTLFTRTEVVGLRENRRREGRRPTGLAVLRVTTRDQDLRPVLDFWRCAMLPLGAAVGATGHHDDLDAVGVQPASPELAEATRSWDLSGLPHGMPSGGDLAPGDLIVIGGGDVVSNATELARLSLNIASVHHDEAAGPSRRLVYGGHTIGLALGQINRALPSLLTVVGWQGCDHLGPVFEGDTLHGTVEVLAVNTSAGGASLVDLRSLVDSTRSLGRPVLDWRFTALMWPGPLSEY